MHSDRFPGRIAWLAAALTLCVIVFGAFVRLDETGADGLLPIREIGREYFHYDPDAQVLMGSETGLEIGIGQRVTVRLAEAIPTTGGLTLELVEVEGRGIPAGSGGSTGSGIAVAEPAPITIDIATAQNTTPILVTTFTSVS